MKQCAVLFSGGIDSTTALFWALGRYEETFVLTFDYGQRHKVEIRMAQKIAKKYNVPQEILHLDLRQIGGSSLTDDELSLPQFEDVNEISGCLPSTYVPFRNGIFLAVAAAWAEVKGIKAIICGFNVIDSPNYPDTKEPFVKAMEKAINIGTKASIDNENLKILSPFCKMKKSEIIKKGLALGADYSYSISCYSGEEIPCSKCSSCILRKKAWGEIGLDDPLILRLKKEGKI